MAIRLEFIDLVVPIETIRRKYPDGWNACLRDHQALLGGRVWHDQFLFRDGAMSPRDSQFLVQEWTARGFEPFLERDGRRSWHDMCVVEAMFGGPTLPCDWIEVDTKEHIAYLRGQEPGRIVGRKQV